MAVNCHCLHFISPKILEERETREIYIEFANYFFSLGQHKKLFLNYQEGTGKVYYDNLESLELVNEGILKNNTLSIEPLEVELEDWQPKLKRNNFDYPEMADKNCKIKQAVVDIHGVPLALVEDEESNQYLRLDDAKRSGYVVFDSEQDAKNRVLSDLQKFLEEQGNMFLRMKSLPIKIGTLKVDLVGSTPAPGPSRSQKQAGCSSASPARLGLTNGAPPVTSRTSTPANRSENKENMSNGNGLNRSTSVSSVNSIGSATPRANNLMSKRQMMNKLMQSKQTLPSTSQVVMKKERQEKKTVLEEYPSGRIFIEKLRPGEDVSIQVLDKLTKTTFLGYAMTDFDAILATAKVESELLVVNVGDLALVKMADDEQSRAYVLELLKDSYKVAAIDYGKVEDVKELFELPKELQGGSEFVCVFEAPAPFVAKLTVNGGFESKVQIGNQLVDAGSNTYIKCMRWVPDIFAKKAAVAAEPKPKPLQKVEQRIYTSLPTTTIPVKVDETVMFTGFEKGVLYLRTHSMLKLIMLMNETLKPLQDDGVEALEKPPTVGQYVLHKHEEKEKEEWRRALVKSTSPTGVTIEHIDYFQSTVSVPADQLCNLVSCAIFGPTLLKCHLRNFEDPEYPPNALAYILTCLKKRFVCIYVKDDIVDLRDATGRCLSELLLELDRPKAKTLADLPPLQLELNKKFRLMVVHIDDEGVMYFTPSTSDLTTIHKHLNDLQGGEDIENVEEGQLCMVMYEDDWTRAMVKKVNGKEVQLYFFDFGNEDTCPLEDIKELPEDLLQFPPSCLKGTLAKESLHYGHIDETHYGTFEVIARKKVGDLFTLQLTLKIED